MTEDVERRLIGLLGLSMRAGQLISGQEACVDGVRRETVGIVLMDAGASENTRKRLKDACASHDTVLYELEAGVLGHSIGKASRMVAALPKGGMADQMLKLLQGGQRP